MGIMAGMMGDIMVDTTTGIMADIITMCTTAAFTRVSVSAWG